MVSCTLGNGCLSDMILLFKGLESQHNPSDSSFPYCYYLQWIVWWWSGYPSFIKNVLNLIFYFLVLSFRYWIIRLLCTGVSSFRRIFFFVQFWASSISWLSWQNTSDISVIKSTAFSCYSVNKCDKSISLRSLPTCSSFEFFFFSLLIWCLAASLWCSLL